MDKFIPGLNGIAGVHLSVGVIERKKEDTPYLKNIIKQRLTFKKQKSQTRANSDLGNAHPLLRSISKKITGMLAQELAPKKQESDGLKLLMMPKSQVKEQVKELNSSDQCSSESQSFHEAPESSANPNQLAVGSQRFSQALSGRRGVSGATATAFL